MNVSAVITGGRDMETKLKRMGNSLYSLPIAMKNIGKEASAYFAGKGFASQGGVFGSPWARLSTQYAIDKAKRYPGAGILVASGAMQKGFVSESNSNSVLITNTAPYYGYHQSTAERSKLPRRAMAGINDEIRGTIIGLITAEVNRKLK